MNWVIYFMSIAMGAKVVFYIKAAILAFAGVVCMAASNCEGKACRIGIILLITAAIVGFTASLVPLSNDMLQAKKQYQELCK